MDREMSEHERLIKEEGRRREKLEEELAFNRENNILYKLRYKRHEATVFTDREIQDVRDLRDSMKKYLIEEQQRVNNYKNQFMHFTSGVFANEKGKTSNREMKTYQAKPDWNAVELNSDLSTQNLMITAKYIAGNKGDCTGVSCSYCPNLCSVVMDRYYSGRGGSIYNSLGANKEDILELVKGQAEYYVYLKSPIGSVEKPSEILK